MKDIVLKMFESMLAEAGGGAMGARNRGTPGYPVPNEMRPEDHFQLTTDDDPVDEAVGKKAKGIQHLEDLSPAEFLHFLKKYKDLPIEGGLEISEKVDGSARLTFGVEKGRLWVQSKNSPRRYSPSEWPNKPMFAAIHAAHEALESKSSQIKKWWDVSGNDVVIGAEVLYTKIPNTIEYGPNVVMIHSVLGPGGVDRQRSKAIADDLIKSTGNTLTSKEGKWRFEYKRIVDPNDVLVDIKKEYDDLGALYTDLKKIKKPTADQLKQFKQIQHDVKAKLITQLKNQQPAYGPKGGDVEGLIFRDLDNGNLVKLVDKEYFTALNKFLWFYRELLSRGVKVGEKWVPGIGQRLKNYIGDEVIGAPVAKTSGFVSYLKRHYGEPKNPEETDVLLAKYIKDEGLMKGDFVGRFRDVISKTREEFLVVKKDWDSKKDDRITFTTPNGKTREMDGLIKKRTQDAFDEMEKALAGMETTVITVEKIKDEMTRKVALMKVMMGDSGLEKLSGHKGGEHAVEEHKINEASPPKKLSGDQAAKMAEVVQANSEKLKKRNIDITNAKPLGAGANGVAFDLGEHVLKITGDAAEANSSQVIKGKDFPNIVKIFDVFRFADTKYFGIYQEKLSPVPPTDKNEFTEFVTDLEVESGMFSKLWELGNWKDVVDNAIEGAREDDESSHESIARVRKELMVLQRKYQMDKIIMQLKAAKIKFRDFHGGNIMLRGKEHVLIDLGYSKSPKATVDVLEQIEKTVVEGPPPIPVSQRKEPRSAGGSIIGIKPDKALEIIKQNAEKLAKKGVNASSAKAVGEGSRGTAFDVGQDRVLKITNDGKEAVAANKLKGLGLKHVSKIYDVWRFPGEGEIYGVLQEKLIPLSGQESQDLNYDLWSNKVWPKGYEIPPQINMAGYNWQKTRELVVQSVQDMAAKISDPKDQKNTLVRANNSWKALNDTYHIGDMVTELSAKGIKFHDYHAGNIMKRGNGEYVVIDIGYSKVAGGKEPDVLEHIIERIAQGVPVDFNPVNHIDDGEVEKYGKMTEKTRADTVGVTIGRYQPFHKGHAEIIRKLAARFTKVIIIVAGNKPDAKNPFSYDLRREIMDASLPDVEPKLEVYKAEIDGKPTGYLPGILNKIIVDHNSSLEADTAITIMVGEDRFADVKKMLEHSKQNPSEGSYFNPELAVVEKLAGVKNDDDTDRISATRVRQAIAEGNKKAVMDMMDSHLMTNRDQFDVLFKKMREDMKKYTKVSEGLEENLSDVGGQSGMDNILHQNAAAIVKFKNLPANRARPLGYGQMGVAYDLGDKVMKLTTDEDEAKASNLLKGKNKDHIVHVSDVFGLSSTKGSKTPVFAVIEEKLQEMSPEEKSEFNDLADYLRADETIEKVATGNYQAVLESIKELIWGDLKRELDLNDSATPEEKANNKRWKRATQLFTQRFQKVEQGLAKFQFDKMIAELRSLNIQFADYHSGNVMKRGATYVINDLGKSKSPGQDPPFLENIVRSISDAISENGAPGVGTATDFGGTTTRLRAGSSGWSAPSHNMTQDDVENGDRDLQWQEMIPDPNLKMRP